MGVSDWIARLRERLPSTRGEEVRRLQSIDGLTAKLLLRLHDGLFDQDRVDIDEGKIGIHLDRDVMPGELPLFVRHRRKASEQ